jgi:hypothetical protein
VHPNPVDAASAGPFNRRETTLLAAILFGLAALATVGCREKGGSGRAGGAPLTAMQFALSVDAGLQVGLDCSRGGPDSCVSGLCLHVLPAIDAGFFCSATCDTLNDCAPNWRCVQVLPPGALPDGGVERNQFCIPPDGWQSAVAAIPPPRDAGIASP